MIIETLKCNEVCDGNSIEYTYRLIERELSIDDQGDKKVIGAYGIEVESEVKLTDESVQAFKSEIKYITPFKHRGIEFLNILKNNSVSPIHLIDITEEYIEEYYSDFNENLDEIAN
ncbi:MAG: DUF6514 family protein [Clostridium sp.]|uniref:DUF6514 family protein n=1 Tax=Clostridium sp. TaxID=1506 RepID=UPI00303E0726